MNRFVQILLFALIASATIHAREETLEERKQRIVRKYLRERTNLASSDMVVPSDEAEDPSVKDSEKFKQAEISLQREESPVRPIPPPPARPAPEKEDANWLLDGLDTAATDPFSADDPFASKARDESVRNDYWAMWGGKPSESGDSDRSQRNSHERYNPYASRDRDQRYTNPRYMNQEESSTYGTRETDIFGRTRNESKPPEGFSVRNPSQNYGASPESGLLTTPFQRGFNSESESSSRDNRGYQPYKSPYSMEQENRRQQPAGIDPSRESQENYRRSDPYEQWKERSKSYDPTKNDAYLNEMMRKDSR